MVVGEPGIDTPSLTTEVVADTTDTLCERLTCTTRLKLRYPREENPSPERETDIPISLMETATPVESCTGSATTTFLAGSLIGGSKERTPALEQLTSKLP
jgi:hypothetical protein